MPRDPYPFPRLQNDSDFYGQQGKQVIEIVDDLQLRQVQCMFRTRPWFHKTLNVASLSLICEIRQENVYSFRNIILFS